MDAWLTRAAQRRPEHAALETPAGAYTYAGLEALARAAAGGLRAAGVAPGDRVALAMSDADEFAIALHGCLLAGAVAVPIDMRLSEPERAQRAAGARLWLDAPPTGSPLEAGFAPAPDEAATLMHTSGTTAAPRPIALTYANWLAGALGSAVALGLDGDERWLCPMPLIHVGGLSILLRSAIYATTAVVHGRFDPTVVAAALSDPGERITMVSLVPTMLSRLLDAGLREPPTLRWVLLGGGPIAPALLRRAAGAGVPVAPTYGMTEACSQIATHGWPLPGVELRLAGDGEILVRGATVSPGSLAPDGWLHTGDVGALDGRGRLTITGRKADTIVTGGENVAPTEVEAVLLEHPEVIDAGVHARPDPVWGEAVVAAVVLKAGAHIAPHELQDHCAAHLARFKVPKHVRYVDELPRTVSGKLLRRRLSADV